MVDDLPPELVRLLREVLHTHPAIIDIIGMIEEGREEANVYKDSFQLDVNSNYTRKRPEWE